MRKTVDQTQFVKNILARDGAITHLKAQHYNIGCIRKVISNLRAQGLVIKTATKRDVEGQRYTEWALS